MRWIGYTSIVLMLATIPAANYLTTHYGLIPILFGLTATAGTWLAGLALVLRDTIHDIFGRPTTYAVILAGALLSYLVADPFIALASGVAFLLSETADMAVYTPLRDHGYLRAALASNIVGSAIDTFAFLWIAGFAIWTNFTGQFVAKLLLTTTAALLIAATHALLRHRLPARA